MVNADLRATQTLQNRLQYDIWNKTILEKHQDLTACCPHHKKTWPPNMVDTMAANLSTLDPSSIDREFRSKGCVGVTFLPYMTYIWRKFDLEFISPPAFGRHGNFCVLSNKVIHADPMTYGTLGPQYNCVWRPPILLSPSSEMFLEDLEAKIELNA